MMTPEEKDQVLDQVAKIMEPHVQGGDQGYVFFIVDGEIGPEHPVKTVSNIDRGALPLLLSIVAKVAFGHLTGEEKVQ